MVSSFGADSVVLLSMLAEIDRSVPVLMINTLMLFEETMDYQQEVAERLGLTNVQQLRPAMADLSCATLTAPCTSVTRTPAARCARCCRWSGSPGAGR